MSNNGNSALETLVAFVIGAAAGFVAGVLFAPASGQETRRKIQDEVEKTGDKAKDGIEKLTKEAEKGIKVVKEKAQEGFDALHDLVEKKPEHAKRGPKAPVEEGPAKA